MGMGSPPLQTRTHTPVEPSTPQLSYRVAVSQLRAVGSLGLRTLL